MRKHFLYLSNDNLIAVLWARGAAVSERAFSRGEAGLADFTEYLRRTPPLPTFLLTDLVEEDFRLDTIPHVNVRDRNTVLERKLQQLYRTTPYRLAKIVGRLSDGRRDDEVLLCALTNPDLVQAWIDVLLEQRVPIAGVYSVALLTDRVLRTLQIRSNHVLWVSWQANSGWRQTYCQNGRVRFSRLTDIAGWQNAAHLLSEQVGKTVQYLESINSLSSGETLEVHVLSERAAHSALRGALADTEQLRYVLHDIAEVARRLRSRHAPQGSEATPLYLQLMDRAVNDAQFAPGTQRRYADIRRVRLTMLGASIALALVGVGWAGWNFLQGQQLRASIAKLEATTQEYRALREATVAGFPRSKVNAQTMNEAVTYYEKAIQAAPDFSSLARELSLILVEFKNVRLERLVWGTDLKPNIELGYQVNLAADVEAPRLTPAVVDGPMPPLGGGYFQAAVLEAAISPFDGNYRAALTEIHRFAARLATLPGARVSTLALPLDTRAENNLRGSATPQRTLKEARFALQLRLAPMPQ